MSQSTRLSFIRTRIYWNFGTRMKMSLLRTESPSQWDALNTALRFACKWQYCTLLSTRGIFSTTRYAIKGKLQNNLEISYIIFCFKAKLPRLLQQSILPFSLLREDRRCGNSFKRECFQQLLQVPWSGIRYGSRVGWWKWKWILAKLPFLDVDDCWEHPADDQDWLCAVCFFLRTNLRVRNCERRHSKARDSSHLLQKLQRLQLWRVQGHFLLWQ